MIGDGMFAWLFQKPLLAGAQAACHAGFRAHNNLPPLLVMSSSPSAIPNIGASAHAINQRD
jgi:hypothetical protein